MVIFDNLHIIFPRDEPPPSKKSSSKRQSSSPETTSLNVLPNNIIARYICLLLIKRIPHIDIEIRNVTLNEEDKTLLTLAYSKFESTSRQSQRYNDNIKFYTKLILNDIRTIKETAEDNAFPPSLLLASRFQVNYSINAKTGFVSHLQIKIYVDELKISVFRVFRLILNESLQNSRMDETVSLNTANDNTTNNDNDHKNDTKSTSNTSNQTNSEVTKAQNRLNKLIKFHNKFYPAITDVSVHVHNTSLIEVPFARTEDNHTLHEYFEQDIPRSSVSFNFKSVSFNYSKLYEGSAGFEILFNPKIDKPFNLTVAMQLFKVDYSHLVFDEAKQKYYTFSDEVLNIPNYSLTIKTNVLDNLANGYGFKDCVMELFSSASSPILDLDTVQLSNLVYNLVLIRKFLKLRKLKKNNRRLALKLTSINGQKKEDELEIFHPPSKHQKAKPYVGNEDHDFGASTDEDENDHDNSEDTNDDLDDTKINSDSPTPKESQKAETEFSHLSNRVLKLLNEYYPRLDVKLIVEQPRLIIRNNDKLNNRIQILNFSYSLLNFHVLTTTARDYDAKCHVLLPAVTYLEKSDLADPQYNNELLRKEIMSLRSAHFQFEILKNLKVKTLFDIDEISVDVSQLDVLTGINKLIADYTSKTERDMTTGLINLFLNSEIIKQRSINPMLYTNFNLKQARSIHKANAPSLESKIFRDLPSWFMEFELRISCSHIIIGSRSVLIPRDYLSEISGNGFNTDHFGSTHELRNVKFTFDDLKICIKNEKYESSLSDVLPPSTSSSFNTLSPSTNESENDEFFWLINVKSRKLELSVLSNLESKRYSSFVRIPKIDVNIISVVEKSEKKLRLDGSIDDIECLYDAYKLVTIIGCYYLLRETILLPVKLARKKMKRDMQKYTSDENLKSKLKLKKLKDFLYSEIAIAKTVVILSLSDEFKVQLQMFDIDFKLAQKVITIGNKFSRLLVDSAKIPEFWSRVVCLDSINITINDPGLSHKVQVNSEAIRLMQPHAFVVYKFFDNISVALKVAKYLIRCINSRETVKSKVVKPRESKVLKMKPILIKSGRLSFVMEDDPFESELGMIFQLGLTEQRKRLEQLHLFDTASASEDNQHYHRDLKDKYDSLLETISNQWIRKVRMYRAKLNDEVLANKKFLYGAEVDIPKAENNKVHGYLNHPPLLSMYMDDFDLELLPTKFDYKELPEFIHNYGQGVPVDTKYSLLFPTYADLKVAEVRMHLRDYPLPLLHVPRDPRKKSLVLQGHLIITEALVTHFENMRKLHVPLAPNIKDTNKDKFYSLTIEKSLSSVKLYSDIKVKFASQLPSRFVWGQSYQFGIQQVMLNFDQFSKPPVDPSMKLGFWDKMRLIIHGRFKIETGPHNGIEIAFKGSRDPYNLFDLATGFILSFRDNVEWKINENDDSKQFFDITSDNAAWYIPNYLLSPLVCWTRDSSKFVYMANNKNFISSCFAYYLDDTTTEILSVEEIKDDSMEKNVVNLKGGVHFRVGFILERKSKSSPDVMTTKCRPHYDIQLFNPKFTKEDHDSYLGFRSDRIHMAISLKANTEHSYNAIHLSPGAFRQFFAWWSLFSSNMMLPVRRGELFGEKKKSMKFSQHLFTNKYQFDFKSLFLSHIYRDETYDSEQDKVECIGVKAKMDHFLVDLHLRKEPRLQVHEGLARNKQIMKMNFNVGEVHLSGIDLRVVSAEFEQNVYSVKREQSETRSKFTIFDNDKQWFDIQDYEEVFIPSLAKCSRVVSIYPMMYSKRFSYLRDTDTDENSKQNLGKEETHKCLLKTADIYTPQIELYQDRIKQLRDKMSTNRKYQNSNKQLQKRVESLNQYIDDCQRDKKKYIRRTSVGDKPYANKENFHNKFILISMFLKWNVNNRNLWLKYIHFVKLKGYFRKYLSYESISTLEDLIFKNETKYDNDNLSVGTSLRVPTLNLADGVQTSTVTSKDRIRNFDDILSRVKDHEKISEDYLIRIISPQIQFESEDCPDSVILVAAPLIDSKIVSVLDKKVEKMVENNKLETRYGILLKNANIFMVSKEDTKTSNMILNKNSYGSTTNWPPWLGIEICKNGLLVGKDKLLVDKTSIMLTYDQVHPLGSKIAQIEEGDGSEDGDERFVDCAENLSTESSEVVAPNSLRVDIPAFNLSSTSVQYFTYYTIMTSLLFYTEPMNASLTEKLEKLKFSIDFQDLRALHGRLCSMHKYYKLMNMLTNNYSFRQSKLDNESLNDYLMLNLERGNVMTDIYLMMQSILTGDLTASGLQTKTTAEWDIRADQIIIHMLEDDRTPLIDLAVANFKYKRALKEDGSNANRLDIGIMQGFSLLPNASYQDLLEPLEIQDTEKPGNMISLDWSMNRSIGGIKIMENFEIKSQPLKISIDQTTGEHLMSFLFPTENDSIDESPLLSYSDKPDKLISKRKRKGKNKENDEESDQNSDTGFLEQVDGTNSKLFKNLNSLPLPELEKELSGNYASSKLHVLSTTGESNSAYEEDIEEMISRSKKFFSIVSFKVHPAVLLISIKCTKGVKRLLNVQDLKIKLPGVTIEREIMSTLELTIFLKKRIIKTLVSHSGRLLKNKLTVKKQLGKHLIKKPLKPLKRYAHYTRVSELAGDELTLES